MEELNILNGIRQYAKLSPVRMHMPGHKADKNFAKLFKCADIDVTEMELSDNLLSPSGIIGKAEKRVAEILKAKRCFFMTDGSTSGVFSMLTAVKKRGGKIAVARNSHKSVFNICKLLGIEPYVLNQNFRYGILLPPSVEEVERALDSGDDFIGVLLTYPDYYGNLADLKRIKQVCEARKKVLLVDGAHGAHLRYDDEAVYAGAYADIWVDGAHKTLPTLTQGALVLVNNGALIDETARAVNIFRTSSPSYPILASIEYGEYFMEEKGRELIIELRQEIQFFKKRLADKKLFVFKNGDALKIAVDFMHTGVSPDAAERFLNSRKIYCEINDGRYLLFYLSPLTKIRELRFLEKSLIAAIRRRENQNTYVEKGEIALGKKYFSYIVAGEMPRELVPLSKAVGRMCAENVGLMPPCVPIVITGEIITQEVVDTIKSARFTFGVYNGDKIYVTK